MNEEQKYIMYKNSQGGFRNRLSKVSLLVYGSLETMQLFKEVFCFVTASPNNSLGT